MTGEKSPETPKAPDEDFGELTEEQRREVGPFLAIPGMSLMGELLTCSFLFENGLKELRKTNEALAVRVLLVIKANQQDFYDLANRHFAADIMTEHLDANQHVSEDGLLYTGLCTNDGFSMREALINVLSGKPETTRLVAILKKLQGLLPNIDEEDE